MNKPKTTSPAPATADAASKGGSDRYHDFTKLAGKESLFEALRDARVHITAKFRLPPREVETGVEETALEFAKRLVKEYPLVRLKDITQNRLNEEQLSEIAAILGAEEIDQEERAAAALTIEAAYLAANLEELQLFNDAANEEIAILVKCREEESKLRTTVKDRRRDASRWLVESWMTYDVRRTVEMDPEFSPVDTVGYSSPYQIFEICKTLYSDQATVTKSVRQYNAQLELAKVKQSSPHEYVQFTTRFNDAVTAWRNEGADPDDELIIRIYVDALDAKLFNQVKEDFKVPSKKKNYPPTWKEFKRETTAMFVEFQKDGLTSDPNSLIVLKADVAEKVDEDAKATEKPTCPCCCKKHRGECFDTEAIQTIFDAGKLASSREIAPRH